MNNYYTYALINPFTNQPFYIGKGKKNRAMDHINEASYPDTKKSNKHKLNTIREILSNNGEVIIKYIDINLTEKLAFELEMFIIELLGRRDKKTGILTNLTDGGEGLSGLNRNLSGENNPNYGKRGEDSIWWGRHHTEETKRKQSEKQKGKIITEEHKQNMRKPKSEQGRLNIAKARLESDYRPSEETKRKTSLALKDIPKTLEHSLKISEALIGVPKEKVKCPHCTKIGGIGIMKRWHFDNCKELVI